MDNVALGDTARVPDAPQPDPKHERTVARAVLQWIKGLRAEVAIEAVEGALMTGSAVGVLAAISRAKQLVLNLWPVAQEAGTQAIADIDAAQRLNLRFDIHDPRFELAVERLGAHAIVEIDTETRQAVRQIISDGYRNGWHPKIFAPTIAETVGLTSRDSKAVARQFATMLDSGMRSELAEARAKRYADKLARKRGLLIGRTETLSAHNISRREAWLQAQRNGLFAGQHVYEEWLSVQTDPNEICYHQNGKRVPLGFTFDGLYPPAHPACLPGDSLVLAQGVSAVSERWYDGNLVVVRTASGNELVCTPNHPILTPTGWVAAGLLKEGDDVVSYGVHERVSVGNLNHEDAPTRIHDVAEAFRRSPKVTAVPMPVAAPDFHGDGMEGQVAVVWADGLLRDGIKAARAEDAFKRHLVGTNVLVAEEFAPFGGLDLAVEGDDDSAGSVVGGSDLARSLLGRHLRPADLFGLGLGASSDPVFAQDATDRPAADPEAIGEGLFGDAAEVFADNVVSVKIKTGSHGVVYNLQTDCGYYVAEGIVTHNCRCVTVPVFGP